MRVKNQILAFTFILMAITLSSCVYNAIKIDKKPLETKDETTTESGPSNIQLWK